MEVRRVIFHCLGCWGVVAAVGCSPSGRQPSSGTGTVSGAVAASPTDRRLQISPREDLAAAIRLAQFEYETDNPQEHAAVLECRGDGAVVVHLMLYRDRSSRKGADESAREERAIFQYDVIPFPRVDAEPRTGQPAGPSERSVNRTLVIDVRRDLVQLSLGQVTEFAAQGKYLGGGESLEKRSYARRVPDAEHEKMVTVIAAADLEKGHQPYEPWFLGTAAGETVRVKNALVALEPGTSASVAMFETPAGRVSVAIEHLPFRADLTAEELDSIAAEYLARARQDPGDVAARYWFAWAAIFSARPEAVARARRRLAEAQEREPNNPAVMALRSRLAADGVQSTTFGDERAALMHATELLGLRPTALDCDAAAYALTRQSATGFAQPRTEMIAALLHEALTLDAAAPVLLPERLSRWRTRLSNGLVFGEAAVKRVLDEFEQRRP